MIRWHCNALHICRLHDLQVTCKLFCKRMQVFVNLCMCVTYAHAQIAQIAGHNRYQSPRWQLTKREGRGGRGYKRAAGVDVGSAQNAEIARDLSSSRHRSPPPQQPSLLCLRPPQTPGLISMSSTHISACFYYRYACSQNAVHRLKFEYTLCPQGKTRC